MSPKAQSDKRKIDKSYYIKIKMFYATNDATKKVKKTIYRMIKVFPKHLFDNVSTIYKELLH